MSLFPPISFSVGGVLLFENGWMVGLEIKSPRTGSGGDLRAELVMGLVLLPQGETDLLRLLFLISLRKSRSSSRDNGLVFAENVVPNGNGDDGDVALFETGVGVILRGVDFLL